MMLMKGARYLSLKSQKINTRSSMESESMAGDATIPKVLWSHQFMETQGYDVEKNIMFQGKMSCMQLMRNMPALGLKRRKHIRVRYLLIQDKITQGKIDLKHCPTEQMQAVVLTKQMQGIKFKQMQVQLTNYPIKHYDGQEEQHTAGLGKLQECTNLNPGRNTLGNGADRTTSLCAHKKWGKVQE